MAATLPDTPYASYHPNSQLAQWQQAAGEDANSLNQQYQRAQLHPLLPGQALPQRYPHIFQQARPMEVFGINYAGGLIAYGHHQSMVQPYHQLFQGLQHQVPMTYSQIGTGYYPAAQYLPGRSYGSSPSTILRQDHDYLAPLAAPAINAGRGVVTAGQPGPPVLGQNSSAICKILAPLKG
jgi:hypothetical protein